MLDVLIVKEKIGKIVAAEKYLHALTHAKNQVSRILSVSWNFMIAKQVELIQLQPQQDFDERVGEH